jgi:hypothetical protein
MSIAAAAGIASATGIPACAAWSCGISWPMSIL